MYPGVVLVLFRTCFIYSCLIDLYVHISVYCAAIYCCKNAMHFKRWYSEVVPSTMAFTAVYIELLGSEPFKFALFMFLQTPSLCVVTYNPLKFHNLKFLETYLGHKNQQPCIVNIIVGLTEALIYLGSIHSTQTFIIVLWYICFDCDDLNEYICLLLLPFQQKVNSHKMLFVLHKITFHRYILW